MNHRRPALLPLALALACTLPLGTLPLHAAEAEPVAIEAGFKPAESAPKLVQAPDVSALKGIKRVAITQLALEFVTQDSVSAQTSGFGAAGRATASGFYTLVGVAEADFQALVDAQYSALAKQLREAGIEVVGHAQVAAAPTWRKLVAGGDALPQKSDSSVTVGLPGAALYGVARMSTAQSKPGLFGGLSAIGAGFSAVGAVGDNLALQEELGGAALMEVTLKLHFAQLTNHNKGFFGRLGNTAQVSAKVHPVVTQARVQVQAGPVVNSLSLKQPLLLDPEAFIELREKPKSTGDVAGAVAVGLLRLAIGSKDSHSSEAYEAVTEPARYRERVGAGLATVGDLFVARIAAAR
jgi:hypothetical protein